MQDDSSVEEMVGSKIDTKIEQSVAMLLAEDFDIVSDICSMMMM